MDKITKITNRMKNKERIIEIEEEIINKQIKKIAIM